MQSSAEDAKLLAFAMPTLSLSTVVLDWAAEQIGESYESLVDGLAKRKKDRERLLDGQLTIAQAQKVSATTGVPYGLLFLQAPPELNRPAIPDLRQVPDARQLKTLSRDFQEAYEDALRKQQWYASALRDLGASPLSFVGKFRASANAESIAGDISSSLKISERTRSTSPNPEHYFGVLAERAESLGILVMKTGIVKSNTRRPLSVEEFRGFAIADDIAPLVFVNGRDAEVAAVFTLLHELAHVWIGYSGVSDLSLASSENARIERLCNQVAADVLVPKEEFLDSWDGIEQLQRVASKFRVSRVVIARRALGLTLISRDEYLAIARSPSKPKSDRPGGNPYATIPVRNSKRLTSALVKSVMAGETLIRDAASLLNIRPETVMEIGRRRESIG